MKMQKEGQLYFVYKQFGIAPVHVPKIGAKFNRSVGAPDPVHVHTAPQFPV